MNPQALTADDLGRIDWKGRGLDGREIRMRSKVKNGVLTLRPRISDWREWIVYASGKSQDWITKVLNGVFSHSASVTFPATLYFGLWRSALSASSTGSTAGEVTTTPGSTGYAAYARVAVTANTTNFSTSASGSSISNLTNITWGADASGTPTIISVGIFDASSAGNLLYWGDLTSVTLAAGDTPQVNVSGLTASES